MTCERGVMLFGGSLRGTFASEKGKSKLLGPVLKSFPLNRAPTEEDWDEMVWVATEAPQAMPVIFLIPAPEYRN